MNDIKNNKDNQINDDLEYQKSFHQSLRRIKYRKDFSKRRLNPRPINSQDSTLVVLVNFIVKDDEILEDYIHPIIGSIRQAAMFLKSKAQTTQNMSMRVFNKIDNCRKDIKTIAKKNSYWIKKGKKPFNSLSDFNDNAWLIFFIDDYQKAKELFSKDLLS